MGRAGLPAKGEKDDCEVPLAILLEPYQPLIVGLLCRARSAAPCVGEQIPTKLVLAG
jgi:hypothetical protein